MSRRPIPDYKREEVLKLADSGMWMREIAKKVHVARSSVYNILNARKE